MLVECFNNCPSTKILIKLIAKNKLNEKADTTYTVYTT
ncbi:MAG: hypothetical protein RL660_2791 [Bacteroidota bacterium]|jgi:sulfur relay (sulfurtransferase) DsrC/TusE family protein